MRKCRLLERHTEAVLDRAFEALHELRPREHALLDQRQDVAGFLVGRLAVHHDVERGPERLLRRHLAEGVGRGARAEMPAERAPLADEGTRHRRALNDWTQRPLDDRRELRLEATPAVTHEARSVEGPPGAETGAHADERGCS